MGRFDPRYSTEQKQAVCCAVLDRGHTVSQALELARTGRLGLEPFEMVPGSASNYVSQERAKRRGEQLASVAKGTPEERLDAGMLKLLGAWEHQVEHVAEKAKRGILTVPELDSLKRMGGAGQAIRALHRGLSPTMGGTRERRERDAARATSNGKRDEPSGLAGQMLQDLEQAKRDAAQQRPALQGRGTENSTATNNSHANSNDHEHDARGVPVRADEPPSDELPS